MTQESAAPRAPELTGGTWITGVPLTLAGLAGRAVLIDFWDYTDVNCLRTLPYLAEWHRRYAPLGLVIIGVHAPHFAFAKKLEDVQEAIKRFGIEYPVVLDNDYTISKDYANQYWPAKYLIDANGYLRFYHSGEGAYPETEWVIQQIIREVNPDAELPDLMQPVRDIDMPDALCYRITPELYLGHRRGSSIGNPSGFASGRSDRYKDPGKHAEGFFYLDGEWLADDDYVLKPYGGDDESRVTIKYTAREVNLVMNPALGRACRVQVIHDGAPLKKPDAGEDVRFQNKQSYVEVTKPGMYRLVDSQELDSHELTLTTDSTGLALYAYTFGSSVVADQS